MFVHMQDQVFHHKKQAAQQALNNNQLQQALELYTEALWFTTDKGSFNLPFMKPIKA